MMNRVGVVGQGFVGGTMTKCLRGRGLTIETYDKFSAEKSTTKSIVDLVVSSDILFVCVPTPMKMSDGSCDTHIVDEVLGEISEAARNEAISLMEAGGKPEKKIAIIRSTVPPGTTESLQRKHPNIEIMFNPEFLREAHAENDFMNQTRIVLGGDLGKELLSRDPKGRQFGPMTQVALMYRKAFPEVPILNVSRSTAEMVKYMTNIFLATKVSLANEFYDICQTLRIDYDKAIQIAQYDERLGPSHWKTPGPDGDRGFGGHCLPKDLQALMATAKSRDVNPVVMKAVWDKNESIRRNRDWEEMEGRAVTDDRP